jgi:IS5 family transposase
MAARQIQNRREESIVIPARRLQISFADGFFIGQVNDLWEPWMRHADQALNDDQLLAIVTAAGSKLCKKSKTRGRTGTPAEIIVRLLLLKHIRDWSCEELAREVRANLVYREFTRIDGGRVPDDKSISRFGRQLGPEVIGQLHQRMVAIARENKVVQGRKLRVDTTVVETNIHYRMSSQGWRIQRESTPSGQESEAL